MVCWREKILAARLQGLSRAEDEEERKERGEVERRGAVAGFCGGRSGQGSQTAASQAGLLLPADSLRSKPEQRRG